MAITTPPTVDTPSTPPDPSDRATFNTRAYPWSVSVNTMTTQLATFAAWLYSAATEVLGLANSATSSASDAATAKGLAESAAASALASWDSFDDRYLGAKASDPTTDNDGNALQTGALYYRTGVGMRVWGGIAWEMAYLPASGYLSTGDIGATVQAYDADLTAWAGKTAPAGAAVGTSDAQTLTNKTLAAATFSDGYTEEVATANTGTAYTISLANGSIQLLTLTGNCTFTFPAATAGRSFVLLLKQDGTGSRTVTWPATAKWPASTAPTITATANKLDRFVFTADGSVWLGAVAGQNYL